MKSKKKSSSKWRPLRIAQIAPMIERVPPKKYGGTERMVYVLTEELVKMGHEVTLYASGDSVTSANLVSVYSRGLREAKIDNLYGLNIFTLMNFGIAYGQQSNFDIIHDHNGYLSLPTANLSTIPVVMTLHGPLKSMIKRAFETFSNPHLVAISKSQAATAPNLNYAGVIHHGLDIKKYPYSAKHDGYLLYVGRISLEKGVHYAIEVAQTLDIPLVIAAKLDPIDVEYFREYIEPKLSDEQVKWIGEVDSEARNQLMSRAMCFLHPATWREPFGLTLIEAQACGCPVVAFNRGSIPEIVIDGKTGYTVDDADEMVAAVSRIDKIDRAECRRRVLSYFNSRRMAKDYENVYFDVLERNSR